MIENIVRESDTITHPKQYILLISLEIIQSFLLYPLLNNSIKNILKNDINKLNSYIYQLIALINLPQHLRSVFQLNFLYNNTDILPAIISTIYCQVKKKCSKIMT